MAENWQKLLIQNSNISFSKLRQVSQISLDRKDGSRERKSIETSSYQMEVEANSNRLAEEDRRPLTPKAPVPKHGLTSSYHDSSKSSLLKKNSSSDMSELRWAPVSKSTRPNPKLLSRTTSELKEDR